MIAPATPVREKLFCRWKAVKESLDRKTRQVPGWNKYLEACMTHPSLLKKLSTLLAPVKKGPSWFKDTHDEYRIDKNFQILYCEI